MKITYISLAALLIYVGVIHSEQNVRSEEQYHIKTHQQNQISHHFAVLKSKADKCPRWIPGEQQPPLRLETACEKALAWAKANLKPAEASIRKIELQRFGQWQGKLQPGSSFDAAKPLLEYTPPEQLWFYFIEFDVIREGQLVHDEYFAVIVLMDGSTVAAEITRK